VARNQVKIYRQQLLSKTRISAICGFWTKLKKWEQETAWVQTIFFK